MVTELGITLVGIGASYTGGSLFVGFLSMVTPKGMFDKGTEWITSPFVLVHSLAYQIVFWSM